MKLLLNVEHLRPPVAGIARYILELFRAVRRNGAAEEVVCVTGGKRIDPDELLFARRTGALVRAARSFPLAYVLRDFLSNQSFRYRMRGMSGWIYHEPCFVLRPFDGPCVVTVHDLSYIHYPQHLPLGRRRYLERNLPRSLDRADRIITVSQFVRHELISIMGVDRGKVTAISLGVDSRFRPRHAIEVADCLRRYNLNYRGYILSVSTLEARKNIVALLRAYTILSTETRNQFPLVLVGARGWKLADVIETLSTEKGLTGVRLLGHVPDHDLACLYSGAALFVYPSLYEGFGLPPLEAMASGVPVVASCISAIQEVVGAAGKLVDPYDPEDIAKGITEVIQDDSRRQIMAQQGIDRAALYTWEQCAAATIEVYRSLGA